MAESKEQRKLRYLRERQLKGRRTGGTYRQRERASTGGYWSSGGVAARKTASVTFNSDRAAESRFVDETIKVQRAEYTAALQEKITRLRQMLAAMSPADREQMEERIRETIRSLRETAQQRRQRYIQYRNTQRQYVSTAAADRRRAASSERD